MRTTPASLAALAIAAALAGPALAQNDECTGAVSVVQGANGPYSNFNATTSFAWPCGAGGNDLWYVYVALGAGTLTADLCGSGFDTVIELFDGNLGCGSLTSLGCNDDSCGLQSSITATVNPGDLIYIRVGGYSSRTGIYTLNISGPIGNGTVATATAYGTGCYNRFGSFYEFFTSAANFDLSNTAITMLPLGNGDYTAIPGITAYVTPTAAAVPLTLTDDSSTTAALTAPFPVDGSFTTSLDVGSNGWVASATGNSTAYTPSTGTLLNNPATAWYCWRDMNPAAAGSGQVLFEEIAGIAYITYDGVYDYGGTGTNTMQFQMDCNTGLVHIVFLTMSPVGGSLNSANLVGYSPAGASMDPGSIDISAVLPSSFSVASGAVEGPGVGLAASGRPLLGAAFSLVTSRIPTGTAAGVTFLGFRRIDPGLDLSILGMPGCSRSVNPGSPLLFLVSGTDGSVPLAVPNNPAFMGQHIFAQSATFTAGFNAFNMLSSNGVDLRIGNL